MSSSRLAIDRAKEIFGAEHANVQPHSGAQANMAVFLASLTHGDKILGMNLSHGGHLTHGHPMNFSGINYEVADYGVSKETEQIDYDELQKIAEETQAENDHLRRVAPIRERLILQGSARSPNRSARS